MQNIFNLLLKNAHRITEDIERAIDLIGRTPPTDTRLGIDDYISHRRMDLEALYRIIGELTVTDYINRSQSLYFNVDLGMKTQTSTLARRLLMLEDDVFIIFNKLKSGDIELLYEDQCNRQVLGRLTPEKAERLIDILSSLSGVVINQDGDNA